MNNIAKDISKKLQEIHRDKNFSSDQYLDQLIGITANNSSRIGTRAS